MSTTPSNTWPSVGEEMYTTGLAPFGLQKSVGAGTMGRVILRICAHFWPASSCSSHFNANGSVTVTNSLRSGLELSLLHSGLARKPENLSTYSFTTMSLSAGSGG